jgi:hypothetical protein
MEIPKIQPPAQGVMAKMAQVEERAGRRMNEIL